LEKQCFIIVNPTSGSFSQRKIDRIASALTQGGVEPVVLKTQSALDATLFASRICAEHSDPLIAVAAGDGTVNGVLNGLAPGVARLAVIPLGTSNVLARELNIRSVADAVRRIIRGQTRQVPIGELRCPAQKKRFLLMAGVGVDGAVVQGVRLAEKKIVGKAAYVLSALRMLSAWDTEELEVSADGRKVTCHSVIICNAAKYGGNFVLSPRGDLFTPGFQVICISGGPMTYFRLFLLLALGRVGSSKSVTIFPATDIEVAGGKAVQLDGDYFGCAPVRLRSIADFVRVIV
jgi:diacylglycerol kinase (ATP)